MRTCTASSPIFRSGCASCFNNFGLWIIKTISRTAIAALIVSCLLVMGSTACLTPVKAGVLPLEQGRRPNSEANQSRPGMSAEDRRNRHRGQPDAVEHLCHFFMQQGDSIRIVAVQQLDAQALVAPRSEER